MLNHQSYQLSQGKRNRDRGETCSALKHPKQKISERSQPNRWLFSFVVLMCVDIGKASVIIFPRFRNTPYSLTEAYPMSEQSSVEANAVYTLDTKEKSALVVLFRKEAQNKDLETFRLQIREWVGEEIYNKRDFDKVDFKFKSDKLAFAQKVYAALGDDGVWFAALKNGIASYGDKQPKETPTETSLEVITSDSQKGEQIPVDDSRKVDEAPQEAEQLPKETAKATTPAKKAKEGKVIVPDTSLTVERSLVDVKKEANKLVKNLNSVKAETASSTIADLIALTATTADNKGREDAIKVLNEILDQYRVINFKMYKGLLTFIRDFSHLKLSVEKVVDEYPRRQRMIVTGQKDALTREFKAFYTNGTLYKEKDGKNIYKGVFFTFSGGQGKGDIFSFTNHYEEFVNDAPTPEVKAQKAIQAVKSKALGFISLVNDTEQSDAIIAALKEDKEGNIIALETLLEDLKKA